MNDTITISLPVKELAAEIAEQLLKNQTVLLPVATVPPAEIISTDELCKRLDISVPTAMKMRKENKLPFFTIGVNVRYNWIKVIEALETQY